MISSSPPRDPTSPSTRRSTSLIQLVSWRRFGMTRMMSDTYEPLLAQIGIIIHTSFDIERKKCSQPLTEPRLWLSPNLSLSVPHPLASMCPDYITSMGQKQSSQPAQSQQLGCVIDHPRFRQARLLTDKQGESIQIAVPVMGEGEVVAWQKGFKGLLSCDVLLLPLSFEFQRTQLCGANGICKVKFDNYPFLLRDQINNRRARPGKPFENEELWYLGLSLVEAAKVLHTRGEKVGDVQPGNVFINDNGQAKVACQHSWPHQLDNYQKIVFQKVLTYLAPEEMKDLHFGLTESKADPALAQSFSIGLTLLDSAVLSDSSDLYSLSSFRIEYQRLEQRRLALRSAGNVDQALRQIIMGLTEVQPKERLTCTQVYNWMEQYRQRIVNMESFEIRELPPWARGGEMERKSLQVLKPHTQPPFYVDSRHYQPVLYEEPQRIVYERPTPPLILPSPQPQQQWVPIVPPPHAFAKHPSIENFRAPPLPQAIRPVQPITESFRTSHPQTDIKTLLSNQPYPQVGVYESGYVQVPAYAPSIAKNEDFRSTLQKIDEQLAVSRKMFPIN